MTLLSNNGKIECCALLVIFADTFTFSSLVLCLYSVLSELGLNPAKASLVFTCGFVGETLGDAFWPLASSKIGVFSAILACLVCELAAIVGTAFSFSIQHFCISQLLKGFAATGTLLDLVEITKFSPKHAVAAKGRAFYVGNASFMIGAAVSSLVYVSTGWYAVLILPATILFVTICVCVYMRKDLRVLDTSNHSNTDSLQRGENPQESPSMEHEHCTSPAAASMHEATRRAQTIFQTEQALFGAMWSCEYLAFLASSITTTCITIFNATLWPQLLMAPPHKVGIEVVTVLFVGVPILMMICSTAGIQVVLRLASLPRAMTFVSLVLVVVVIPTPIYFAWLPALIAGNIVMSCMKAFLVGMQASWIKAVCTHYCKSNNTFNLVNVFHGMVVNFVICSFPVTMSYLGLQFGIWGFFFLLSICVACAFATNLYACLRVGSSNYKPTPSSLRCRGAFLGVIGIVTAIAVAGFTVILHHELSQIENLDSPQPPPSS